MIYTVKAGPGPAFSVIIQDADLGPGEQNPARFLLFFDVNSHFIAIKRAESHQMHYLFSTFAPLI